MTIHRVHLPIDFRRKPLVSRACSNGGHVRKGTGPLVIYSTLSNAKGLARMPHTCTAGITLHVARTQFITHHRPRSDLMSDHAAQEEETR